MSDPGFPNVHVRLRVTQQAPALAARDDELEIWLAGTRFRVRDRGGREPSQLLGELTAPRGLGVPARTMEAIMDQRSAARRAAPGPTDIYGDTATGEGWVYPPRGARWAKPAAELAPLAVQLLDAQAAGLDRRGDATRLERAAAVYRGTIDGTADGQAFHNQVVRIVAPPYLLLDDTRDANNADHYYVREVVALDEGTVTDADLTPP